MNIFRNIKKLDISNYWSCDKNNIHLPKLEHLLINNERSLLLFIGLTSLKHLCIIEWYSDIELDDIFDPSKVIQLNIN